MCKIEQLLAESGCYSIYFNCDILAPVSGQIIVILLGWVTHIWQHVMWDETFTAVTLSTTFKSSFWGYDIPAGKLASL